MRIFAKSETKNFLAGLDKRMGSAQAWLETPDGKLLIVKSDYKQHWSVPGGIIDAEETPLEAVQREVHEEIGIELPLADYSLVIAASRRSPRGYSYQFIFKADFQDDVRDKISLQPSEIEEAAFVTREQVMSGDRNYGHAIIAWAKGTTGYAEFVLD